jgi:ribosomal protein S18 acetylase RimI-like enzyme
MIEITSPDQNDLAAIVILKREVHALHIAHAGWHFFDPGDAVLAETIRSRLADSGTRVLVARHGNQVVGYVSGSVRVRPETPISRASRAMYLDEICVSRDCRRAGTGRLLVEAIFAAARVEGIDRVELDTWAFNADAARFFEKLGFQPQLYRYSVRLSDS